MNIPLMKFYKIMLKQWKVNGQNSFLNISEINLVASVFYPRIKLNFLQELLTIYNDALVSIKDDDSSNFILIVYNVRIILYNFLW